MERTLLFAPDPGSAQDLLPWGVCNREPPFSYANEHFIINIAIIIINIIIITIIIIIIIIFTITIIIIIIVPIVLILSLIYVSTIR